MADTAAPVLCGPMSAYTQFGYSYPAASQLLVAGQPTTATSPPLGSGGGSSSGVGAGAVSPGGGAGGVGGVGVAGAACCESGRPLVTDPVSGQSVCSCQYDSARLALSSYPRLSSYGAPYPSTDQNPYPSIGVDSSAFYSPLSNPYALKDGGSAADMGAWTSAGLQPTTGYYPYDPTLAAYGYGAGYDLAARRKNATRESTATLKAWLNEHKKNPYPTKGEKIMLAIITKMTLTQVSTWFANARRRLKKENKMTWEPKNKTDDDDDAIVSDGDDKEKDDLLLDDKLKDSRSSDKDGLHHVKAEHALDEDDDLDDRRHLHHHHQPQHQHLLHGHHAMLKDELSKDCGVPLPATKPKIWSLADTAACKTPPPPPPAAQQPWLVPPAAPATAGAINSFALPSPASSAGAAAPYSRYGGLITAPYGGGGGGVGSGGGSSSGFPEVQTDTPPQTPPNMKLPSVAVTGNLVAPSSGSSCFGGVGGGMGLGGMGASSSGYGGHHANAAFLGGFSRLQQQQAQQQQQPQSQSPHKEQRGLAAMAGVKEAAYPQQQPHHHHQHPAMMAGVGVSVGGGQAAQGPAPAEGTAFKPFYKGYVRGDDAAADALEQCVRAGVCDGAVRGASPD